MRPCSKSIYGQSLLSLLAMLAHLIAPRAFADDILVYNNNNSGPGSLRQAVIDSNGTSGTNRIVFSNTVTGVITLSNGQLTISTNAIVLGPGPELLTLNANGSNRLFNITGGTVLISGLDIANGDDTDMVEYFGGGILNRGNLVLSNCVVRNCTAPQAGGIANLSPGSLTAIRSTIRNNSDSPSIGIAGGIASSGALTFLGCSVISNVCGKSAGSSDAAGGIFGPATMTNCTVSGNSGGLAAILTPNGDIWHTTIAANIGTGLFNNFGSCRVGNCIIAANNVNSDVVGNFTSAGYNFIGRSDFSSGWGAVGDQFGSIANPINPNLWPLGNYGSSLPTMPPQDGSLVIDQGKNFGTTTDQRGRPRTYDNPSIINATLGDGTDIGAVELGNSTLVVSNSNDSGPGSLRQTIVDASPVEQDTVTFATNVTNVITLTSGELVINKGLNISGPGANKLTISGNNSSRVFHLTDGLFLLSGLTIANGLATNGSGGGILADAGFLSILSCQIKSNAATSGGGGISVAGNSLNLAYSSVTHNQALFFGGGIAVSGSPQVVIYHSTIASNRTTYVYEGILSPSGGGISLPGGSLLLVNSTIAGNHSTYAGGGLCNGLFSSGTAEIRNSIIAANTAANVAPDVVGPFLSDGFNLIGNSSGSTGFTNATDQLNVNPLLGPLGNYGGTTLTMPLQPGSPAIDKGYSFSWPTDQRGFPRPRDEPGITNAVGGDGADIGALEQTPVNGGPTLFIQRDGGNVVIAWFPETPGFALEETSDLTTGSWSPAPPGNPTALIPMTSQQKFYRLSIP